MIKNKKTYSSIQFIPKTNTEQSKEKKNDSKLSYDEIRNIIENRNEKELPSKLQEKQIKNKFNIA
jgi:hypothetical protein